MKISHDWLRGFVPHACSPVELGDLLSRHVVTLEAAVPLRSDLDAVVVARVVESERIPETKLSFNKVDDGTGLLLEVVCGAPNVAVGTLYPFARSGTTLPGGLKIEKRKIRGFTSNGMLCSARELGLGSEHDGILALDVDVATGTPLLRAMPIGDTQLDLDVLPNRPDLLSHLGVAREVGALTRLPLVMPAELRGLARTPDAIVDHARASAGGVSVSVEDAAGCPRYVAVVLRGVKVAPSPEWLVQRLASVGARSVNNVVDATNYLLHGLGQPVHAFDLARLSGQAIVVRKARAGEKLTTLDGVERSLEPWMTIIADGARATALAGVMGGRDSEVTATTVDVLLEVAAFSPRDVRKVRRALMLSTDASYRFERGVDAGSTEWIAGLAAGLVASVAGGTIEALLDVGSAPAPAPPVLLRLPRVTRLLGASVPSADVERLLTAIGFRVEGVGDEELSVTAPSWRHDVARDVDLIEEIARLRGYDLLPDTLQPYRIGTVPDHPLHRASRRVRDVLVAAGLAEARPMPFGRDTGAPQARVANPLAEDEPFLRSSLLETLSRRAEYNLNQHQGNVRLFEIGHAFTPAGTRGDLPLEELRAAAVVMGERRPPHFTEPRPPAYDAWDAKWLAFLIGGAAFPGAPLTVEDVPASEPHAAATALLWRIVSDGRQVGEVRVLTLDAPVWASPAFGVEVALGHLSSAPVSAPGMHAYGRRDGAGLSSVTAGHRRYTAIPSTPASTIDVALLVPNALPAAEVERVIRRTAGDTLEQLSLFDEFRGAGVPDGHRSLAWRLTFRHPERTLRDKEIEGRRSQLLKTLENELGVTPRAS